jgi:hypothetical protein
MEILKYKIIAVELKERLKTVSIAGTKDTWEISPLFDLGNNDNGDIVQNLDIKIVRNKHTHRGTIIARTSFLLTLGSKEYQPTSEKDFEIYTLFAQIGIAHARAFFIRESNGTPFAGDLLNMDTNEGVRNKMILAININRSRN